MQKEGHGMMDGTQKGRRNGGRGKNSTTQCRNPLVQKRRNSK